MATKANQHSLNDQLEITRQRFNHLYQCFRTSPTEQALLPEALEEFSNSLEELAASAEESCTSGRAGGLPFAGPSKGPTRKRVKFTLKQISDPTSCHETLSTI
jgi:hypothetical protein